MRVTANMSGDNSLYNIQKQRSQMDKLQEQTTSGQNVNRPSDDPIASRLLMDIADKVKSGDQYTSNIKKSKIWQQFANTALTGMSDIMQQAVSLINTTVSGTTDTDQQKSVASQLQALKQQLVDMGNTQMGDQYIFGGANNSTPPFSSTSPYYSGDETSLNIEIGNGSIQTMNIPGNQILTADTAGSQPYGTTNILKTFDNLIAALGSNNTTAIKAGAKELSEGSKQIFNAVTDVGSRLSRLDNFTKMLDSTRSTLMTVFSNTQTVDYAKLGVELTQQQNAFEASLSSTAKISKLSLLDYM